MAKFGKWIGAGLGAFAAGPIGAIIGFIVGSAFDGGSQSINQGQQRLYSSSKTSRRPTTGGYAMSLLVLAAAIMKADGKVRKPELDYVKQFFVHSVGVEEDRKSVV